MALVSVVVPTANRPDRLTRAVRSVLNQRHQDVEVLIVYEPADTASEDVVSTLRRKDDRVRGLEIDAGTPMQARNAGIDRATGEYLAFLDDDDIWDPARLDAQLSLADEYSFVSCIPRIVRPEKTVVQPHDFTERLELSFLDVFDAVRFFPASGSVGVQYVIPSCILTRTDQVRAIDGFRRGFHEWDLYLKLVSRFGPGIVLDRPLVDFDRTDIDRYSDDADVVDRLERTYAAHASEAPWRARRRVRGQLNYAKYRRRPGTFTGVLSLLKAVAYDPYRTASLELSKK